MKYTMYFAGLIACFFSIVAVQAQENKFLNSPARKLQLAEFAIANLYVDEVNEGKLVEEAIVKMLEQLDPHSTYSDPEEVKKMNEPPQGSVLCWRSGLQCRCKRKRRRHCRTQRSWQRRRRWN